MYSSTSACSTASAASLPQAKGAWPATRTPGTATGSRLCSTEALDDDGAGVADVGFSHFGGGEGLGDGNRAVEVVGVGGAEAGNRAAGLGPGGGELRVRVDDAADLWELAVEERVRVEIAGRTQGALDDFAVEVGDDQVFRLERGVIDAAGLDDDQGLGAGTVDAAGVAEGVGSKAAAGDFLVGVEDLFAKRFEQHGVFPCLLSRCREAFTRYSLTARRGRWA